TLRPKRGLRTMLSVESRGVHRGAHPPLLTTAGRPAAWRAGGGRRDLIIGFAIEKEMRYAEGVLPPAWPGGRGSVCDVDHAVIVNPYQLNERGQCQACLPEGDSPALLPRAGCKQTVCT